MRKQLEEKDTANEVHWTIGNVKRVQGVIMSRRNDFFEPAECPSRRQRHLRGAIKGLCLPENG